MCLGSDDEGQGWSESQREAQGEAFTDTEAASPRLPGPRAQVLAVHRQQVGCQSSTASCDRWPLARGHFQLPASTPPCFSLQGIPPAHPPTPRQLGRRPSTGANQLPASKETQAHGQPRGQQKGLSPVVESRLSFH